MKRADAGETPVEGMAARVDVADLRMHETMQRCAGDDQAAADSRADGEVYKGFDIARRPPPVLGQSRRVDIVIEADRTGELPGEGARDIDAAPSRLRGE